MDLHRKEIQYASSEVSPTDVVLQASVDRGSTWVDVDVVDGMARILLAGPDVVSPPGDALVITENVVLLVRATDNPEQPIRKWGTITLWG